MLAEGDHRHVVLGWPLQFTVGRLGSAHRLAALRVRERALRAGALRLLGPAWLFQGRRLQVQALTSSDVAQLTSKLSAELVYGRLAVRVIVGIRVQDGLTSSLRGDRARYTDSPSHAFVKEPCVSAPFGFRGPWAFQGRRLQLQGADLLGPGSLTKKLSSELANRRLARKALIGRRLQDWL